MIMQIEETLLLLFGMYVSGQELVKFGHVWFCCWIRLCVWIRLVSCLERGVTLDLTWILDLFWIFVFLFGYWI
ncbi:hypothetical protein BJV82DRAFT_632044 [Fennellomyces sp. T-0311]|nr:hypothetical protein BJV82DRAFT_631929 [Fennellomyces sp. T-0311]KAI8138188.1 hypothetical protein BJV82DRAFT_632044 [Fennellomyces sp. T-0311]